VSVDLQWGLLTNASANLGNALVQGAGQIRQRQETSRDRSAITNYLSNPSDQAAFTGLAERNPTMAFALRDDQVQRVRALRADQQGMLRQAGELLRDVRDDQSYQRALAAAGTAQIDIAGAPPNYDPDFVGQIRAAARALAPAQTREPTSFQQDLAAAGIQPGTPEFRSMLENRYAPPPFAVRNDDGTTTFYPRPPSTTGQPPPTTPSAPLSPEQLRAAAEEAIRRGADPAQVEAELRRVLGEDTRPANDPAPAFHPAPAGPTFRGVEFGHPLRPGGR
jgi:hypothetical protein